MNSLGLYLYFTLKLLLSALRGSRFLNPKAKPQLLSCWGDIWSMGSLLCRLQQCQTPADGNSVGNPGLGFDSFKIQLSNYNFGSYVTSMPNR